jgi:hypothetical protein
MSDESAAAVLLQFLEEVGDAPEVIWAAAVAVMRRALGEAEEARFGRFRHYPQGQLRRLRSDVSRALKLARLAVDMQEAETERDRELTVDLHAQAAAAGAAARRAQTLPAQLARLEKQRRARLGLPAENFHLQPGYALSGVAGANGGDKAGDGEHELLDGRQAGAGGAAAREPAKRPRADVQAE